MFCQRDVCAKIVEPEGDYLFTVKGNQLGLERDIAAGFAFDDDARKMAAVFPPEPSPPLSSEREHVTLEKRHGRVEKRTVRTTSILTLHQKWPGLAQGVKIVRERTIRGKTSIEVEYAMTSLKPEEADAKRLSDLVREHWGIENELHYVRDVTLAEDACRVRRGSSPQVLAAVRNAVVHILAGIGASSTAVAIRRLNARPEEAIILLDLSQSQ
jgi:predicted transposase YbfD/YdcC